MAIFTFLLTCLVLAILGFVLRNAYFSPLSKIPNAHWSSSFSPLWILWMRYHSKEMTTLHDLHQKLGPLIRVGPKDLSVSSYNDGVRVIYGGSFEKPSYFDCFRYYGEENAFCSKEQSHHKIYRRRSAGLFSKSSINNSAHMTAITKTMLYSGLMPFMERRAQSSETVDVMTFSVSTTVDWLDSFIFGRRNIHSLFGMEDEKVSEWLGLYHAMYGKGLFWPQELPALTSFLSKLGCSPLSQNQKSATKILQDWLLEMCDKAEKMVTMGTDGADPEDIPVIYEAVKNSVLREIPEAKGESARLKIASELFDYMTSAPEVLAYVFGYALINISRNTNVQAKLRAELLALATPINPTKGALPTPISLENLPYLDAVIKECLRTRPNNSQLPRVTPKGRAVSLAGYDCIPPETRVNTFPWFLHRDPNSWHEVEVFKPERWLTENNHLDSGILWPFVSGSRTCLGNNFSTYVMRYALAAIYSNFITSVPGDYLGAPGGYATLEPLAVNPQIQIHPLA